MKKLLLCLVVFIVGCSSQICFEECYPIEIADSFSERQQGLMFRESLEGGMLFVFDSNEEHTFWMKNTLIPLDMIWLDEEKVTHVEHAVPCVSDPCERYSGVGKYVLELNADSGIEVGDEYAIS